jgi:polyisoprenoid-binding protein YceI
MKQAPYSLININRFLFFLISAFFLQVRGQAQELYKVQKASVVISGTSTLHDWEMKGENFTCNTTFKVEDNKVVEVKNLQLVVAVQSLKSGKSAMDKNAYAALKANEHKQITYTITSSKVVGSKIVCTGNLSIAGVTKPFEVESTCTVNVDNTIACKASKSFKMSEFKVEPPSFMFGSVTTGDNITLVFDLSFKKI